MAHSLSKRERNIDEHFDFLKRKILYLYLYLQLLTMQKNLCCTLRPTINKKYLLTKLFFRDNFHILTVLTSAIPAVPYPPIYKISPLFTRTPIACVLFKGASLPFVHIKLIVSNIYIL